MLRIGYLFQLAAAGLFVIPATGVQDQDLGQALQSLVESTERLAGLQERLDAGETQALAELLELTEPPREELLKQGVDAGDPVDELRHEVSRLREELDAREHAPRSDAPDPTVPRMGPGSAMSHGDGSSPTGSNSSFGPHPAGARPGTNAGASNATPTPATNTEPRAFEPEGYSASAVRHGRVCYLAGRYEKGLEVLARVRTSPEARYWIARCTESLGRHDDAIELYRELIAAGSPTELVSRAELDLDFLEWKVEFRENSPLSAGGDS